MCGRYSIYESMDDYLRQLALDLVVINSMTMSGSTGTTWRPLPV